MKPLRPVRWAQSHWAVLLGAAAVAGLVLAVGPRKMASALDAADPRLLALMLPCALVLYLAHGVAWWAALRAAGADVGLRQTVQVTYASQALVFLPGGDLWRVPLLKHSRVPVAAGTVAGAVVFDDLSYLLVLTVAMVPAVVIQPSLWPPLLAVLAPQACLLTILTWRRPHDWLLARVRVLPGMDRFGGGLEQIGPTFRLIAASRRLPAILALQLVCSALAVTLFGLGLAAVHARIPAAHLAYTYAGGQVAASIAVFPAALGAYEGLMTGLLAVQGVAPAVAAVAALLYRFVNDVLLAVAGLLVAGAADLRASAPISWRLFRLGFVVRPVWSLVERFTAWHLRIEEVRPGGVLRFNRELRDGRRLLELHLGNPRLAALSAAGPWVMLGELRSDLRVLARRFEAGEFEGVEALHGTTLLAAAGTRLGFELRPLPPSPSLRLHRFFFVGLVALHNPAGPRAVAHERNRWPAELWMTRERLLARYGSVAALAA